MVTKTPSVDEVLQSIGSRWARLERLRLASRLLAALAAVWLVAWAIAAERALSGEIVLALMAGALVASLAAAAWIVRRRAPVPSDLLLARFIEERCPDLDDRLVTAVDVRARAGSTHSVLEQTLQDAAASALSGASLDDVVPESTARRTRGRAALAAVLAAIVAAAWIAPARRGFDAAVARLFPDRYALHVTPGSIRLKPGEPLVIRARTTSAAGIVPDLVLSNGTARDEKISMSRSQEGGFAHRFDVVPASFRYRVTVAGRTSPTYEVTLLTPPRLERIDLHYEFPAYTRLEPRDEEDGGDIYAPAGSKVTLRVHTGSTAASGALALGDRRVPLAHTGGGLFEATLPVTDNGSYRVSLTSRDGVTAPGDTEYFIRVLDDRPPDVRIVRPAGDRQVTPLEEVTIEARADDDYGVASLELVYGVRGAKEKAVPIGRERGETSSTGTHTLYLEDLGVQPGDFVTYYARAKDVGRGRRSTEARSDIYFLEVKPFQEEFAAAQSQAMSGAGGGPMDDLVAAQKDIIVATWKLDRRSAAGRSAADVKSVARAQGELKQRAERAAGPFRRRPRPGQLDSPRASDDPMTTAVVAMARAQAALDAVRTSDAIPPEMEALNALLRAQAEIRRREVMRQQASGGGGFNRSRQDLSSLFDRELQRQQQTNYETPRNATDEAQNRSETLDRLRELARRQEQLARQQDDLARSRASLSAEELKRRLERLTRDQTELRRQAEQLAQQMASERDRREQSNGSPSAGQSAGERAQRLREASEEMRGAASELRRDDPSQASARSGRALDRLRSLERQMRGQAPDERRRALGDLQLEARQMADRQRQLGEQAAGQKGRADEAGRAQMAAEQERLAERADRLENDAQALAASKSVAPSKKDTARDAGGQNGPDQAAQSLRDARVAERMRELAKEMRQGAERPGSNDGNKDERARDLARALDRAAEQLGAAANGRDAADRQVADALSRSREVRERLEDLQHRIDELRKADGRQGGAQQGKTDQQGARAGSRPAPGQGESSNAELERLQREYSEQVREAARLERELSDRPGASEDGRGGGSTPEGQAMVRSAPGTEAFKQDFSQWEALHRDVTLRLERLEATLSQRLLEQALRDRLPGGAADEAPGSYQQAVDRYFKALAAPRR
jgi:hypothetical protein